MNSYSHVSGHDKCLFIQLDVFFIFQDTLIVWSEADNYDLALSFQEKAGCDEVWEKICQVNSVLFHSVLCIVLKKSGASVQAFKLTLLLNMVFMHICRLL